MFPVDRKSKESWELYKKIKKEIGNGFYIAVAPEGKRGDGKSCSLLNQGPLFFAIENQLPIIPVVIQGSAEVLPRRSLWFNVGQWRREVVLRILSPVDVSSYEMSSRGELKSKVYELMAEVLYESSTKPVGPRQ